MNKPQMHEALDFLATPAIELRPLDADAAAEWIADLKDRAETGDLPRLANVLDKGGPASATLGAVLDLSPFLRGELLKQPQILDHLFDAPVEARIDAVIAEIDALDIECTSENELMARLRRLKRHAHVLLALADLTGRTPTMATAGKLSALAMAATRSAVRFLLRDAHDKGKLKLPDPEKPEEGAGWFLIAMGKLGADELNYSSDIDMIGFFDENAPAIAHDPLEATETFSRLTRRLIRILQDRTADGYVFRVDLRLRPDPGSTPLAIPVGAALHYYESRGQNWERAAMIKARGIAGDMAAAEAVLAELQPYVWRKYLDFAAIQDVHSIKRQIHAHRGHGDIAVRGHNVKLGRGGIREIEFFVQTQQLIAGGRFPELRGRRTLAMLDVLADKGWIEADARDTLADAYCKLRGIEHRIQMVRDEQTHMLPEDDEELLRIARLSGHETIDDFSEALTATLRAVERFYARLFEMAPQLSGDLGNLVFTGDGADPDTVETLAVLGFERPADMIAIIRVWHYGRYRATQSAEARERLTELTPALLRAFSATGRPDDTLIAFDSFIKGLPAGVQLFSLLHSNPALLDLLMRVMGAAPRLGAIITRRPHIFDGLLDPALFADLPTKAYLSERLTAFLRGADLHEEVLDRLRIFAAEQKFLIGMRLLTASIDAVRVGKALSDLADLVIGRALEAVIAEFETRHGRVPGGRVCLLGLGKLGSRELTAGSDVDLILLYDHDEDAIGSDGDKSLDPTQYHIRLTQRLIAAVSAPTAEGVLYEIDLRLRPSGNKGPVATHIEAFDRYQQADAWIWEHMALTRARAVAGDEALAARAGEIIDAVIERRTQAPPAEVFKEAREMRKTIEQEKPASGVWDVKLAAGGIIDLEFIAQTAVLTGALGPDAGRPVGTQEVLRALGDGAFSADEREALVAAHRFYLDLTQITRLCVEGGLDPEHAPAPLLDLVLGVTDLPDFDVLEAHLKDTQALVRKLFNQWLGGKR